MAFDIYLSPPNMGGTEMKYIKEAFDDNWIAPLGSSVLAFEKETAAHTGVENALALCSGTAAIHLALRWYGVGAGDTVFCSDFTFAASCNPILYQNAEPVFIDSEPESWNMSPAALEKAFHWAKRENRMPKAVIIVDLYGESADWDALLPICRAYGTPVIEDAAEAVGSAYNGKRCGSFGDISIFSYNGNKIITTSGGGMALSDNAEAIEKMRFWSTQAREPYIHYEHKEYGYNYRMSNICAAIGRGQLEYLGAKIAKRKNIRQIYSDSFSEGFAHIKKHAEKNDSNCWLNALVLDSEKIRPADIVQRLSSARIEARPVWKPMHMQPVFKGAMSFPHNDESFIGEQIFQTALCLPSGDGMSAEQQQTVICEVKKSWK